MWRTNFPDRTEESKRKHGSSQVIVGLPGLLLGLVALLLVTAEAKSYGVNSLSTSGCHFAQNVDNDLGDDRSPVVVGSKGVYYVGDSGTGSFFSSDLTLQTSTETLIDGLFSDLGNGHLWTFATSSEDWLNGDSIGSGTRITHLIPLAADAEGNLDTDGSRDVVTLSTALNPYWDQNPQPRIYLGMGELVFTASIAAPSEFAGAFLVDIATGEVTRIHEMADGEVWTIASYSDNFETENWVASGVMERTAEGIKLLSVYSNWDVDPYVGGVYRYNLDGSLHSKLYTGFLDDCATFTVNYWSNDNKRWFAHAESAPTNDATDTPRIPGLTDSEWILSCVADHYNSGSTMSCAVCSLVSALWSLF